MPLYLIWLLSGLILIMLELMTGTFYLLVFGIAALVAAAVALLGGDIWLQSVVAGALTLLGVYLAHAYRAQLHPKRSGNDNLDIGQVVVFDRWRDQHEGLLRVSYRGTIWDARAQETLDLEQTLYIVDHQMGILLISNKRPSMDK